MARREWFRLHFEYEDGDLRLVQAARAARPTRRSRLPASPMKVTVLGDSGREGATGTAQADTCCVAESGAGAHDHLRYMFEVLATPSDRVRLTYPGFSRTYRLDAVDRPAEPVRRPPMAVEEDITRARAALDKGDRWIVVALANGFTVASMPTFVAQVRRLEATLKATQPFDRFASRIDVIPVRTLSPADTLDADSAFGHSEEKLGDNWFRFFVDQDAVARFMTRNGFTHSRFQPLVVANTTRYGGSGGPAAVFSLAPEATEIAIHEIGHSEFGLSDEYSNPIPNPHLQPFGPNVQAIALSNPPRPADFAGLKWKRFVNGAALPSLGRPTSISPDGPGIPANLAAVVGAFEGGLYQDSGVYRPQLRCAMRASREPFCKVCSDVIGRRLNSLTGLAWTP